MLSVTDKKNTVLSISGRMDNVVHQIFCKKVLDEDRCFTDRIHLKIKQQGLCFE